MPGSVNTELRQSALDTVNKEKTMGSSSQLSPERCALLIHDAAFQRKRQLFIPTYYSWVRFIYLLWPELIDSFAIKKYGYV
jgi:hypothetical protein